MMSKHEDARFGFVILHYLVDKETVQCVESIKKNCGKRNIKIVIVDNNSANGSFERLQKQYGKDTDITLLHNQTNEGFARGNNVGYVYCRNELNCDYIVTINNDAMIASNDFVALCEEDYSNTGCGVIGPDIISLKEGRHQNPSYGIIDTRKEVNRQLTRFRVILFLLHTHLFHPLTQLKARLRGGEQKEHQYTHETAQAEENRPYKLHGACLIFTPAFVYQCDEAFDARTFLYFEEHILVQICRKMGVSMFYDPRITVEHEEDASTDHMMKRDERRKQIFVLRNYVRSLKVLKQHVK